MRTCVGVGGIGAYLCWSQRSAEMGASQLVQA